MRKLWLAWEDDTSIRSRVLAGAMDAEYRAFTRFEHSRLFGWLRYPVATLQTVATLLSRRPDLLVVQNPSIVLAFEAAVLRSLLGYRLVIDLHTPFNDPTGWKKRVADALHRFGLRHSDAIVVTNEAFRRRVMAETATPVFVLPDMVPDFSTPFSPVPLTGALNILYVCTFSLDEPWQEVIEAGSLLPDDVRIHVSGRAAIAPSELPPNVRLTGYLPRAEYEDLLRSVDAVMVLTSAEENLVCGGYEAVAAGKPLILSDTGALRELYGKGAVFTANRADAIAAAIGVVQRALPELRGGIQAQREDMATSWSRRWDALLERIDAPRAAGDLALS